MVSWTVKNYSHNAQQENKISSHCSLAVSLKLASSALCGLLRPNITYSAALARAKQLNFPFAVTLAIVNRVKHRESLTSPWHTRCPRVPSAPSSDVPSCAWVTSENPDECNEAIACVAEVWSELSEFPAIVTGLFRTEVKRSINKRFYKWYMRSRRPIL